jgi:hypothetical protein
MAWLDGETEIVKSPTDWLSTTRVTVVVRVRLPLTPVIVTLEEPTGVVLLVVTFMVEVLPVVLFGLKDAEAPTGNPVAVSVTAPGNPPVRAIVTV